MARSDDGALCPDGGAHDAVPSEDDPGLTRTSTIEEIRETYADQADTMDRFAFLDRLLTGRYRRKQFWSAEGRVLDVACGLATNVEYLPETVAYVGIDVSPEMLARAEQRNDQLELGETLREMDAQNLDFPDDSFDTVISSLSTCTFPDPDAALAEMARVCKPGGRVLLLEHGRSDVGAVARFQDWYAPRHFEKHACRWNQEPLALVERSPLTVLEHWTAVFGIVTGITATPE